MLEPCRFETLQTVPVTAAECCTGNNGRNIGYSIGERAVCHNSTQCGASCKQSSACEMHQAYTECAVRRQMHSKTVPEVQQLLIWETPGKLYLADQGYGSTVNLAVLI